MREFDIEPKRRGYKRQYNPNIDPTILVKDGFIFYFFVYSFTDIFLLFKKYDRMYLQQLDSDLVIQCYQILFQL